MAQTTPTLQSPTVEEIKNRLQERAINSEHPFVWEDRKHIAEILTVYNLRDESFSKLGKGFSLKKGNLIMGTIGSGKTAMMECAKCDDWARRYHIYQSRVIAKMNPEELRSLVCREPICIDDLGFRDEPGKNYGTSIDNVTDLLLDRYQYHLITHATTNLDQAELIIRFEDRMVSRFSEMFNIIVMKGDDLRKS